MRRPRHCPHGSKCGRKCDRPSSSPRPHHAGTQKRSADTQKGPHVDPGAIATSAEACKASLRSPPDEKRCTSSTYATRPPSHIRRIGPPRRACPRSMDMRCRRQRQGWATWTSAEAVARSSLTSRIPSGSWWWEMIITGCRGFSPPAVCHHSSPTLRTRASSHRTRGLPTRPLAHGPSWPPANCLSVDMSAPDLHLNAQPTTEQVERIASRQFRSTLTNGPISANYALRCS